jgi:hypothetical protein
MTKRRLLTAVGLLAAVVVANAIVGGVLWLAIGIVFVSAWWLPASFLHGIWLPEFQASVHRAEQGWPTRHDRFVLGVDRVFRGAFTFVGAVCVLYGLTRM